jgi:hypothetical protein
MAGAEACLNTGDGVSHDGRRALCVG